MDGSVTRALPASLIHSSVCIYTYIYIYIHTCIYIYICMCIYIYEYAVCRCAGYIFNGFVDMILVGD